MNRLVPGDVEPGVERVLDAKHTYNLSLHAYFGVVDFPHFGSIPGPGSAGSAGSGPKSVPFGVSVGLWWVTGPVIASAVHFTLLVVDPLDELSSCMGDSVPGDCTCCACCAT